MDGSIDRTAVESIEEVGRLVELVSSMPMTFSSLVIENTNRCNARCAMCYQSAGPRGSEVLGDHSLNETDIFRVIEDGILIKTVEPRLHLAGGESFIYRDQSIRILEHAAKIGYLQITVTTNAYWARTPADALHMVERLFRAGLTNMEVSWDEWHRPYIAVETIENAIHACHYFGIDVTLRVLGTKSHNYHDALKDISDKAIGRVAQITAGPVFPTGRAASAIDPAEFHSRTDGIEGSCHSTLNLTINASGNVFPCCSGLDQTGYIKFGNIRESSIIDILRKMNSNLLVRVLVFGGPKYLIRLLKAGGNTLHDRQYDNICHACWTIFSNAESVSTLQKIFSDALVNAAEERILNVQE